jgi:hypothetical protein
MQFAINGVMFDRVAFLLKEDCGRDTGAWKYFNENYLKNRRLWANKDIPALVPHTNNAIEGNYISFFFLSERVKTNMIG